RFQEFMVLASQENKADWQLTPTPPQPRVPDPTQTVELVKTRGGLGTLCGVVRGHQGKLVPEALIKAIEVQTGFEFTSRSNHAGRYQLHLPVGEYQVTISAKPPDQIQRKNTATTTHRPDRYFNFEVIEVYIQPQTATRLNVELTMPEADPFSCGAITYPPRQPDSPTCIWTKSVKPAPDGSLTFPTTQATSNSNWTRIIMLQLKDGSVRWVLRYRRPSSLPQLR
ncbi:MAG TPA: carboxypeptidase-like regulatory domain-containing protein, partial [Acidobacteriota bacterium]|nr:carboxypeptidase-like regulatory domain-containing protein [Acidobacteriota bacterium]